MVDNDSKKTNFSEQKQDLAEIEKRLNAARETQHSSSKTANRMKAPPSNILGLAFRVSVEVVSALAVGFAIGWLLDTWLVTKPWFMLVFIVIGAAAGMLNVYRLAKGFGYAPGYEQTGSETENNADESDQGQGPDRKV